MATEIKVWQIKNNELISINSTMTEEGREELDLKKWIESQPEILGKDILIIGKEVQTESGSKIDFLGIDTSGNTVIIEVKRDGLPREILGQAIDYASEVAPWDLEVLDKVCKEYRHQALEDFLKESKIFQKVGMENITFNQMQRILLVGTAINEKLQRMIEWLSEEYKMSVNAVIFKYIKTNRGDELLARTMIIPEDVEKERAERGKRRKFEMSDKPGDYTPEELKALLKNYLYSSDNSTSVPVIIREILLPLCLQSQRPVSREEIITELINKGKAPDPGAAGTLLSNVSTVLGHKKNDFLRQVIDYDKEGDVKDNYRIREGYEKMIEEWLKEFSQKTSETNGG